MSGGASGRWRVSFGDIGLADGVFELALQGGLMQAAYQRSYMRFGYAANFPADKVPNISGVAGGEKHFHAMVQIFVKATFHRFMSVTFFRFRDADALFFEFHFFGEGFFHIDE
jgi:hypothetical protein